MECKERSMDLNCEVWWARTCFRKAELRPACQSPALSERLLNCSMSRGWTDNFEDGDTS
jgi:hypothetical protein